MVATFKDVNSFIINHDDWYRGKGVEYFSYLLNKENKKCCLGFYALACGLPEDAIREKVTPRHVKIWDTILITSNRSNSLKCKNIIYVNDDPIISDNVREQKLIKLFKELNIEVKFQ